jgi:capsular exopolysaccharide synthesis family protein
VSNIVRRDQVDLPSRRPLAEDSGFDWQDQLNARRLVSRLLKRKRQVLFVFLAVVAPAVAVTYLTTPLYKSSALVQVNPDPVQVLPYRDVADAVAGAGSNNYDNYVGTQDQILRGAALRTRVARRLQSDFKEKPEAAEAARLADNFDVRKVERSELFELSYLAPNPSVAATVVNLYAEEYAKQNFELRQATRVKAEEDLKKELTALESRMQLSEKELMTYARTNDILSLEQGQVDPLQERLSALTQQVTEAEATVATARSGYQKVQQASLDDFPQGLVTDQISQVEGKLLTLEQDLTNLRATFGENWPAVKEKRGEVNVVREQLAREKTLALARSREQARLDLEAAEVRRQLATQSLDQQKTLVNRFHDASIQYNILKRDVDTNRNLYEGLLERLRQTGVMTGFQFGNIQVIEPGRPSRIADSPKVVLIVGLAALLGLALGVCLVVLQEFWDNSISTLEDAEQLAPLPSLGSIPLMVESKPGRALLSRRAAPSPNPPNTSVALQPAVPFHVTESMRSICASILLSRSDERPRVIVVTSSTPSEGKTTLVTHLGRAFAEAGSRTLLIEADMRKPDLAKAFSVGNEDGLSLYLAGHVSPWPKIHETAIHNLFVTSGGPVPPNPAALLHSERLSNFLRAAAADYQVVIVDAPPLSMADARILGANADGVVLVVRAGRTARNLVRRSYAQLEAAGANVLGMVLNGEEPDAVSSSYYQRYHYSQSA